MKTYAVTIDRENCIGCEACEAVCPEVVFKLSDDGKIELSVADYGSEQKQPRRKSLQT